MKRTSSPSNTEGRVFAATKLLSRSAAAGTKVTYGELMKECGISRGLPLSRLIGEVDRMEEAKGGVGFAAIVVRRDTGYPGGGYFCDYSLPPKLRRHPSRGSDPRLSPDEVSYVRKEQMRVWTFYCPNRR